MVDDVAVFHHQVQKVMTYLKLQMKRFVLHMKNGVAVIICPNDLLTQKIKDTTNRPVDTSRPVLPTPSYRSIKKLLN